MLRFASSPTRDMHVGDLRVALFNYIVSKQRNEDFIVRIEDLNKEKNIEDKDKEILDILHLFGLEYSQTIYQSEGVRFHTAMALQLIHEKKAFSCFCSDAWLDKKKEEAKINNTEYKYDDACANLPAELVIDNLSPFCIRINQPIDTSLNIDSFIIMSQDKTPTYNFATAVDDMLNNISTVISGKECLNNGLKQDYARVALKYEKKVEYIHLPIMLDEDTTDIKWLLEEGFLPEAISNYLISIGTTTPKEIFTISEAMEWLDVEKLSQSPVPFDIAVLKHINKEHLKLLDDKELSRYVGFADEEVGALAKVYLKEVSTTKELKSKIAAIFADKEIPKELTSQALLMVKTIKSAPYFETYDDFKNYIIKESGLSGKDFSRTLGLVLRGAEDGPDIAEVYKYLKNYLGEIVK